MKRCIVIGKTNVGKTLFVLQFAAYLGADRLEITFEEPGGERRARTLSIEDAIDSSPPRSHIKPAACSRYDWSCPSARG